MYFGEQSKLTLIPLDWRFRSSKTVEERLRRERWEESRDLKNANGPFECR
jgi:hypothetical protein